jgi:hypothetical protein
MSSRYTPDESSIKPVIPKEILEAFSSEEKKMITVSYKDGRQRDKHCEAVESYLKKRYGC